MANVLDLSGNYPESVPPLDAAIAKPVDNPISGSIVAGTGVEAVGLVGQFLTTPPTLTNGQFGKAQLTTLGEQKVAIWNGGTPATVIGSAADGAIAMNGLSVVSRPLLFNGTTFDRLRGDAVNGAFVQASTTEYEIVAASQTDQILGATGAVGDLLGAIIIVPATLSPDAVTIKDGNGSAITIFAGGASSVDSLKPIHVPLGLKTINATTPGWKITTGANVSVIGIGNFT